VAAAHGLSYNSPPRTIFHRRQKSQAKAAKKVSLAPGTQDGAEAKATSSLASTSQRRSNGRRWCLPATKKTSCIVP
jgi:hypothetical protein